MRKATKERQDAIAQLRDWIKPGDTVHTILDHVSASGMSRHIRIVVPYTRDDNRIDFLHPNYSVAVALGLRRAKRGDGLVIGGCGTDMGFHLVYSLSATIYPEYACLGKGKCPSNYHVNYRSRIRCDGVGSGDDRKPCYRPYRTDRYPVAEHWPKRQIDIGDGAFVDAGYLAAIEYDDGRIEVCPTCQGLGDLPNPAGPERFDLTHTDGYALRHRWL